MIRKPTESPWVSDTSSIHRVFMLMLLQVLDPNFKLIYFLLAEWDKIWISTEKEITRAEYDRKYSPKPGTAVKPVSYVNKVRKITFNEFIVL
jgi:hypothetical protein